MDGGRRRGGDGRTGRAVLAYLAAIERCPETVRAYAFSLSLTTPQFLPIHRRQRDETLALLTIAEQAGKTRLVDNHRQVAANLDQIITALEDIDAEEPTDATG